MSREISRSTLSGWFILLVQLLVFVGGVVMLTQSMIIPAIFALVLFIFNFFGFFVLQPNTSQVLVLFGNYKGTVKKSGFHWVNPLMFPAALPSLKVSLRSRNLNGETLKVNDKKGNPIEIAAVVVWHVSDTFQALFEVDQFKEYVRIQSEAAVRLLANSYPYDHGEDGETTLRCGVDEVSNALARELQERLKKAGVTVEEARLSHLVYAPEIAGAM
ncbi:SPFH domain-containing protein, partial [bacterium]|nr:SPFH domain-containing protein [bacterium]